VNTLSIKPDRGASSEDEFKPSSDNTDDDDDDDDDDLSAVQSSSASSPEESEIETPEKVFRFFCILNRYYVLSMTFVTI